MIIYIDGIRADLGLAIPFRFHVRFYKNVQAFRAQKKMKSCQPWSILGCPTRWFPPTWHWNIQKIEDVFNLMMMFQLLKVSFESVGDAPFFPSKTNHFQPQKMGSLRLTVISSTPLAAWFSRMSLNQDVSSLNDPISSIPQPSHIAFFDISSYIIN